MTKNRRSISADQLEITDRAKLELNADSIQGCGTRLQVLEIEQEAIFSENEAQSTNIQGV